MLSVAIRNSVARRVPATATPMLGRGFSNVYSEGSVAQSRGFKSVFRLFAVQQISNISLFVVRRKRPTRVRHLDIRN